MADTMSIGVSIWYAWFISKNAEKDEKSDPALPAWMHQ